MKLGNKLVALTFAVTIILALNACGQTGETEQLSDNGTQNVFPNEKITIVVPFVAGSNTDLITRIVAQGMANELDTEVVVENKSGGGGIIGQTYALNNEADGYTMLCVTTTNFAANILSGETDYNLETVRPVGQMSFDYGYVLVSSDSNIDNFEQFATMAREDGLINTTSGFSATHHIASLIFADSFDFKFDYMHTDGGAEQAVQLGGGHAQCALSNYGTTSTLIQEGHIVPLAYASPERSTLLPDVPTVQELGYDFIYGVCYGLSVHQDTPDDVTKILEDALKKAMESETVITALETAGFPVSYDTAENFQNYLENEYESISNIYHLLED